MKRFSALGFSVELDDFGTGHSSFSNLMHFRIDRIKIDRSFVADADSDPSRRALLSAMVGVGKTLGIEVLAEGVETPAQLQVLRDLGCDAVQGYLLARPMDIHQLQAWLAAREGSACAVG